MTIQTVSRHNRFGSSVVTSGGGVEVLVQQSAETNGNGRRACLAAPAQYLVVVVVSNRFPEAGKYNHWADRRRDGTRSRSTMKVRL